MLITDVSTMIKLILISFPDCIISYINFLWFWVPLGTIWVPSNVVIIIIFTIDVVFFLKNFTHFMYFLKTSSDTQWYPDGTPWYPKSQKVDIWDHTIWKRYQNQFYHSWNVCYELSVMLGFNVKTLIFEKLKIWSHISWRCTKIIKSRMNTAESAFESLVIILVYHTILVTIGVPCRSIHLIKMTPWKA